jgi:hypothetical protein
MLSVKEMGLRPELRMRMGKYLNEMKAKANMIQDANQ